MVILLGGGAEIYPPGGSSGESGAVVSAGKLAPEVAPGYGNRGRETPDESAAAPPTLFGVLFLRLGPCSGGRAFAPPSEGPSGATVEAAGRLSPNPSKAAAPPPKAPALAQAGRKRRPRSPRSPALGKDAQRWCACPKTRSRPLFGNCDIYLSQAHDPRCPLDSALPCRETVLPERRGHT